MTRWMRWMPIMLLAILTLIIFWKLAFTDLILARGDTFAYFYPYWDARNSALQGGQLPLWSSNIFMGIPLLANPQLGTFYPPNWLTIPFAAPQAVRISILLHIVWAGLGVMALYWVTISKNIVPALLAGIVFAFGGYISAHIEQINQLQGIAWMAWLFLCFYQMRYSPRRIRWSLLLAMAFAMQIFTGHTQTVFITGIGLGIYAIGLSLTEQRRSRALSLNIITLALAAIGGAILAIPQLLPTLEVTGMSNRGGGFTSAQATAFSLYPPHLARYLLPSYDTQFLGEAVATIGILALCIAIVGIIASDNKKRWLWVVIGIIGILFAFGRFNPLYWGLASLPGFNLFRAPVRWLALYALAIALLTGMGWESLVTLSRRHMIGLGIAVTTLAVFVLIALIAALPQAEIIGSITPTKSTVFLWGITVIIFVALMLSFAYLPRIMRDSAVVVLVTLELFVAGQSMPYNDLVAPEVYAGQRFTISQMLAYSADAIPTPRFLSISALNFDTGDRASLRQRYEQLGMDEQAIQTAFTAIKKAEVIAPNLPLTWGVASIDGYGGGVLPTIYYSQFTSLLLPEGALRTSDGRVGEMLALPDCRGACIPSLDYLRLTDTRYLITDKVYDIVQDGIRFDTTFAGYWADDMPTRPDFEFDEVQVLHTEALSQFDSAQVVEMDTTLLLSTLVWDDLIALSSDDQTRIVALSVVDNRTGDFLELQPAAWQRVLSSDIKLYELQDATMSRVALSPSVSAILPDDWDGHEGALQILRDNPQSLIIHGDAPTLEPLISGYVGSAEITRYTSTEVDIRVSHNQDAYLMLKDAYYAGWRATVDGESIPVYRANVLFRAVRVPAGEHMIQFEFVPMLWYRALWLGAMVWLIALGGLVWALRPTPTLSDDFA